MMPSGDLDRIVKVLSRPQFSMANAAEKLPRAAGIYAVFASADAANVLELDRSAALAPIYVGKAEDSLRKRVCQTHLSRGRTGSSTLRRSLAALLRDTLSLRGVPRNLANPERFANFGLSPEHDDLLTDWMEQNLELASWSDTEEHPIRVVDKAVISALRPPLNLTGPGTDLSRALKEKRTLMADDARSWRP